MRGYYGWGCNMNTLISLKGRTNCCIPFDGIEIIEEGRARTDTTIVKYVGGKELDIDVSYQDVIKQLKKIPDFKIIG